jgi:hypothetical protein
MNEQLQGKLVEILSGIQAATKAAGDFALEQLPDIAQQYVIYGRVSKTVILVLIALSFLAMLYVAIRHGFLSKVKGEYGMWADGRIAAAVLGSIGCLVSGLALIASIGPTLLVWLAPKVWLLKEIASLIK